MCGIIGYINGSAHASTYDKRKFVEQALIIDTLRGDDGTGLFTVDNNGGSKLLKDTIDGYAFVTSEEFTKTFPIGDWGDYRFAVGHNRSATIGGISTDATHTFREGPITLVHNGTLHDTTRLKASQNALNAHNDSHTICHNLAISTPEEVIGSLFGAFALVWHDSRDDSLNIVRNSQRPLHIAKARTHNTLFFASEGEMLYWLDARINIGLQDIVALKPAHWLKFKGHGADLMLPEMKQVDLYVPKVNHHYNRPPHAHGAHNHFTVLGHHAGDDYGDLDGWGTGEVYTPVVTVPSSIPETPRKPTILGITINGKKRPVPEAVEYDLMEYNLYLDETYKFIPCRADPLNINIMTVTGYFVDVPDMPENILCCIYGVPREIWERANSRMWEVRPVGVKGLTKELDIVVGRLASTNPKGGRAILPTMRVLPKTPAKKQFPKAKESVMMPGPHGQEISYERWLEATESGCIQCGVPIKVSDALNLEWTNDRQDPLCYACQVELESWQAGKQAN